MKDLEKLRDILNGCEEFAVDLEVSSAASSKVLYIFSRNIWLPNSSITTTEVTLASRA